jgi:hypothetical protein
MLAKQKLVACLKMSVRYYKVSVKKFGIVPLVSRVSVFRFSIGTKLIYKKAGHINGPAPPLLN